MEGDPRQGSLFLDYALLLVAKDDGSHLQLLTRLIFACRCFPMHMPERLQHIRFLISHQDSGSSSLAPFLPDDFDLKTLVMFVDRSLACPLPQSAAPTSSCPPMAPTVTTDVVPPLVSSHAGLDVLSNTFFLQLLLDPNVDLEVPFKHACTTPLLPLSCFCDKCNARTYFHRAFPVMIYSSVKNELTRATASFVFRCQACRIQYYHGFSRLPPTDEHPHTRIKYDHHFARYKFFPASPETYVRHDWLEGVHAQFATRAVAFNALAQIFNQLLGIVVPTSELLKYAKVCSFVLFFFCNRSNACLLFPTTLMFFPPLDLPLHQSLADDGAMDLDDDFEDAASDSDSEVDLDATVPRSQRNHEITSNDLALYLSRRQAITAKIVRLVGFFFIFLFQLPAFCGMAHSILSFPVLCLTY
jgi:hypothetical protein